MQRVIWVPCVTLRELGLEAHRVHVMLVTSKSVTHILKEYILVKVWLILRIGSNAYIIIKECTHITKPSSF